jgi:hypothetical protein
MTLSNSLLRSPRLEVGFSWAAAIRAIGAELTARKLDQVRQFRENVRCGGLTKTAAMEYARDSIRVNCVNPGYIATPMTDETMKTHLDELMTKVPMHVWAYPMRSRKRWFGCARTCRRS